MTLRCRARSVSRKWWLQQVAAVSIEGAEFAEYDGVYRHDSTHEGWPVLKNADGMCCYRYTPTDEWRLSDTPRHDDNTCYASIAAEDGPLPVGDHDWCVATGDDGWEDMQLTVTLLEIEPATAATRQLEEVRPFCKLWKTLQKGALNGFVAGGGCPRRGSSLVWMQRPVRV